MKNSTSLWIRFGVAIILLMHSIPGMFTGGIHDFGKDYLDQIGFAPFGIPLAWGIKLSHVFAAGALVANRFIAWAVFITIVVLIMGIVLVHFKEGWYVVGGGRNGMEFNFLLIVVLAQIYLNEKEEIKNF